MVAERDAVGIACEARSVAEVAIGASRDLIRTRSELVAENALLRQQLIVLRRGIEMSRARRFLSLSK